MPLIFSFVFTIFRQLLPAKMTARFETHSDGNIKAANLPSRCVPKEYGGEVESDNIQNFIIGIKFNNLINIMLMNFIIISYVEY